MVQIVLSIINKALGLIASWGGRHADKLIEGYYYNTMVDSRW